MHEDCQHAKYDSQDKSHALRLFTQNRSAQPTPAIHVGKGQRPVANIWNAVCCYVSESRLTRWQVDR